MSLFSRPNNILRGGLFGARLSLSSSSSSSRLSSAASKSASSFLLDIPNNLRTSSSVAGVGVVVTTTTTYTSTTTVGIGIHRRAFSTPRAAAGATTATTAAAAAVAALDMQTVDTTERLKALRGLMRAARVDLYVVPSEDSHQSEYIAPCDARRGSCFFPFFCFLVLLSLFGGVEGGRGRVCSLFPFLSQPFLLSERKKNNMEKREFFPVRETSSQCVSERERVNQ